MAKDRRGVNSKKGCFGRNTKFFRESEDFVENRETWEIFRETRSNRVEFSGGLRFFWECLPKIRDDIPNFRPPLKTVNI